MNLITLMVNQKKIIHKIYDQIDGVAMGSPIYPVESQCTVIAADELSNENVPATEKLLYSKLSPSFVHILNFVICEVILSIYIYVEHNIQVRRKLEF